MGAEGVVVQVAEGVAAVVVADLEAVDLAGVKEEEIFKQSRLLNSES